MGIIMGALGGLAEGVGKVALMGMQDDYQRKRDAERAEIEMRAQENMARFKANLEQTMKDEERGKIGIIVRNGKEAGRNAAMDLGPNTNEALAQAGTKRATDSLAEKGFIPEAKILGDMDYKEGLLDVKSQAIALQEKQASALHEHRVRELALREALNDSRIALNDARAARVGLGKEVDPTKVSEAIRKEVNDLYGDELKELSKKKAEAIDPEAKKQTEKELNGLRMQMNLISSISQDSGLSVGSVDQMLRGLTTGTTPILRKGDMLAFDLGNGKGYPVPAALREIALKAAKNPVAAPASAPDANAGERTLPSAERVSQRDAEIERMNQLSGTGTGRRQGIIAARSQEASAGFDSMLDSLRDPEGRKSAMIWFNEHMEDLSNAQKKQYRDAKKQLGIL